MSERNEKKEQQPPENLVFEERLHNALVLDIWPSLTTQVDFGIEWPSSLLSGPKIWPSGWLSPPLPRGTNSSKRSPLSPSNRRILAPWG
jgi:hypothetical protein